MATEPIHLFEANPFSIDSLQDSATVQVQGSYASNVITVRWTSSDTIAAQSAYLITLYAENSQKISQTVGSGADTREVTLYEDSTLVAGNYYVILTIWDDDDVVLTQSKSDLFRVGPTLKPEIASVTTSYLNNFSP